MTFLEGYVLFGIPALALGLAYLAMRLHEWDLDRHQPPGE